MRLIDADALKKCAIPCQIHNGALTDLCVPLYQIDNAPTVSPERPQGDLISREALLKAMEEERQYLLARGQTGAEHIIVHHCLPIIDNAPTVEVRPQGEWIKHIDELFPEESTEECPFCHEEQLIRLGNDDNYCPNCGADMKGGAE